MLDQNLLNALSALVGLRNHLNVLNQGSLSKNPELKKVPGLMGKMDAEIIRGSEKLFEVQPSVNLTSTVPKSLTSTAPNSEKVEMSLDEALDEMEKKAGQQAQADGGVRKFPVLPQKKTDGRTKRVSEKEGAKSQKKTFEMTNEDFEKVSQEILKEQINDSKVESK